jgi:hypothetical protein
MGEKKKKEKRHRRNSNARRKARYGSNQDWQCPGQSKAKVEELARHLDKVAQQIKQSQ